MYHDSKTKVTIIGQVHGPFQQIPTQHLVGFGSAACASEPRLSQEDLVRRARATHGDKYDYSQAIFRGVREFVRIICRQHGPFDQNAGSHMSHTGCPDCGMERTRLDTEQFVAHAREIHGDRYDYAKSRYVTARTKVRIDCRVHGPFMQRPMHHLQGVGCPICALPRAPR